MDGNHNSSRRVISKSFREITTSGSPATAIVKHRKSNFDSLSRTVFDDAVVLKRLELDLNHIILQQRVPRRFEAHSGSIARISSCPSSSGNSMLEDLVSGECEDDNDDELDENTTNVIHSLQESPPAQPIVSTSTSPVQPFSKVPLSTGPTIQDSLPEMYLSTVEEAVQSMKELEVEQLHEAYSDPNIIIPEIVHQIANDLTPSTCPFTQ